MKFYRRLLLHLGSEGSPQVQTIYSDAASSLKKPTSLPPW